MVHISGPMILCYIMARQSDRLACRSSALSLHEYGDDIVVLCKLVCANSTSHNNIIYGMNVRYHTILLFVYARRLKTINGFNTKKVPKYVYV